MVEFNDTQIYQRQDEIATEVWLCDSRTLDDLIRNMFGLPKQTQALNPFNVSKTLFWSSELLFLFDESNLTSYSFGDSAALIHCSDVGLDGSALSLFSPPIVKNVLLYTEMVNVNAIIHGDAPTFGF